MPKTSLPADSICSGLGRGAEGYTNLAAAARAQLADREPRGSLATRTRCTAHAGSTPATGSATTIYQHRSPPVLVMADGSGFVIAPARDLLAPVCGWFTEGFDTLDLK